MVLNKSNTQCMVYNHGSKNEECKKITTGSFMKPNKYSKVFEIYGTGGSLILKCFKKPGGC
jgi:fructose 1,6-bisphosphatase